MLRKVGIRGSKLKPQMNGARKERQTLCSETL